MKIGDVEITEDEARELQDARDAVAGEDHYPYGDGFWERHGFDVAEFLLKLIDKIAKP
jgi:hypothetical protein